ncbi:MAG: N-acetylmuramic acid 6-phosphate etherase [Rhodospirillales bacterium]|nr:N-acetylmuramic acid 6-phosphate etherase [Rhodospirillales bacterium]
MTTELNDPKYDDLDAWPTLDAVAAMWDGQVQAVAAVRAALPAIARAADAAAAALGDRGRIVYAGAGTSARIAVQDGVELPPTFGWSAERLAYATAGGADALVTSAEGAEDDMAAGASDIDAMEVGPADVVIGVAASGTTPYTVAALRAAASRGAVTIAVANNAGAPLLAVASHPILAETGGEVIAGSTRMKAGTAQKVVLNLLSSAIMIRLGGVYRGMMVAMPPTNDKLRRRAVSIVARIARCAPAAAQAALATAGNDIKVAVLVCGGLDAGRARERLAKHGGNLRAALQPAAGP